MSFYHFFVSVPGSFNFVINKDELGKHLTHILIDAINRWLFTNTQLTAFKKQTSLKSSTIRLSSISDFSFVSQIQGKKGFSVQKLQFILLLLYKMSSSTIWSCQDLSWLFRLRTIRTAY